MVIDENDAFQLFQGIDTMPEDMRPRAASLLADYKTQQEALGAPLWPTQEKIKQDRKKRVQEVFQNPLVLDTENAAFVEANRAKPGFGDQLRVREASILWLADRYNANEADVRKRYDFYKADASQKWGSQPLDDSAFFSKAKSEIDADMVRTEKRKQSALTGMESALSGATMASELARFQEAYPDATEEEKVTFADSLFQTSVALAPHRRLIDAAAPAMRRIQQGDGTPEDAALMGELTGVIADSTGRDRNILIRSLLMGAKAVSDEGGKRGVAGTFAGSAVNLLESMFVPGGYQTQALLSQVVPREMPADEVIDTPEKARQALITQLNLLAAEQRALNVDVPATAAALMAPKARPLSEDEQALVTAEIDRMGRRIKAERELKKIALSTDPMDDSIMGTMASGAASSLALTLPLAMGPAGAYIAASGYANMETEELLTEFPDMDPRAAQLIGGLSGAAQSAMDKATLFGLDKFAPNVRKMIVGGVTKEFAKKAAAQGAALFAFENTVEAAQDLSTSVIQEMVSELSQSVPQVDWQKEKEEFLGTRADVAIGMVPLMLIGAGVNTAANKQQVNAMLADNDLLMRVGIIESDRVKILELATAGKTNEAEAALQDAMGRRSPELAAEVAEKYASKIDALRKVQDQAIALQNTSSPEYTVNVTRTPQGWQVRTGDGNVIDVDSVEAARRIAVDLRQVASQQEAEALVNVIDDYYAAGRQAETVLTGESVKAGRGGVFGVRRDEQGNVIATRAFDAQALETIRREAEVAGINSGTQDIFAHVNGNNEVFPMRVADGAKEIARRLNLYKSQEEGQPQVITFLHENIESSWRLGMANGTFSEQDTRTAMRALLPAFEGVTKENSKNAEEFQFIENLRTLADGKGDETMLRETVSEMVVRDVLGRDRQGRATGMRPGSISRAIEAAVMGAKTQQEASAFRRILAMFRAFSAYLKGVFGTVKAIVEARDEGKIGEEWDTFVNKVLGIDEVKMMEGKAVKEAQEIMDAGNMAFSVSPVRAYHGTDAKSFNQFDIANLGKGSGNPGLFSSGFYFSPKKEVASDYGKNLLAVDLDISNPFSIPDSMPAMMDGRDNADFWKKFEADTMAALRSIFETLNFNEVGRIDSIKTDESFLISFIRAYEVLTGQKLSLEKASEILASLIQRAGFDAVYATDNGDVNEIVVFDEKKIRITERNGKPVKPKVTFSISPIRNLNELSDQVERQFKENPAGALEVKSKVIRQFAKLRDKWSNERWTPKGDKIRPISEKRTVKSLDREQAYRKRARQRELIDEGMMKLTPETLMAWSEGVGTLEKDPLVSKMLNDNGRLMSKATAEEQGKNIADLYDDAVWIPPQWYAKGAGIMPDVMANNLGFDTASEMWAALESSIKSHRSAKEGYAKAEKAVRDVEQKALEQATAEAQAWRDEADRMQQEDWSPRESLVRDLITLEAIVAMFPAEIRGKIGGFVTLARKASESARLKVLQKQLERGQVLLEKHLKDQYGEAVDKLFDKYRPERKAGEKPKGKLDPDAQEIADKAENAMGFSADQTNAEIAAINVLLDADNISAEEETKLESMRELVQLLGDWKNADSARRESAFLALNDVLSEGWAKWKLKQILKREQREEMRKALKSATGKKGVGIERDKMKMEAAKVLGKAARWVLNLSSFGEVMRAVFGEKAARQFIDNERNASNQYEDAIQQFSERIDEFFTILTGSVLRGERLRFDLAQPTLTIGAGGMNERQISQLQGIQALLMWQQEDGKRHMEGPRDENGAPIEGKWSYDQAWIDELTSKLSPEAVEVKKFIEQLYSEEWAPLNAVYRERHGVNLPRHDKYAPITVTPQQAKAGEMVDPVSGAAIAGSILTPGSLRSRNRSALAEPEFRDALSTFIAHTKQMEHWKAYYDLAVEMQSVLGNRDVANSVKAAVGDEGTTVLRKWVDVFAQGGTRDAAAGLAVSEGLSGLAGRVATVGLLGRFSTLLVQSTQLAAASVKMPTGAYLKRFALLMSGNLGWSDAINSEFIQRRIKSAPPLIRQAMQSLGQASRPNQIQRVTRHLGQLLSGADGLFTAGTYAILLDYHRTQGAKMGMEGDALESYAHAEAVNATEQVAQPVRTGARSIIEVTNTNPLAKMSWAYASEARQKMALFAWSAYNAKNDPAGAAKTAFLVFVVGGLMSQVLKNLWREAKGDDDEKKWSPERLTLSLMSPITSAIPGASMLAGEGGSLSGAKYAQYAIKDVFDGDADMKDVDTILSVLGYFNDTAAGIATLSHAGYDFAQVLENAFGEE